MSAFAKPALPLPFGLAEADLATLEIRSAYHSPKSGAGHQLIVIRGDGTVTLEKTINYEAPAIREHGQVPPQAVRALLALLEEERFLALEERYESPLPHATRIITLKMKDQVRKVVLAGGTSLAFERVATGVKLVAGIAMPAAQGHTFFPNL